MKLKTVASAVGLLLAASSASAVEDQFNINTKLQGGQQVDLNFDLGFLGNLLAVSYYADQAIDGNNTITRTNQGSGETRVFTTGNGYVDTGEFVFDIATGETIDQLLFDGVIQAGVGNTPGSSSNLGIGGDVYGSSRGWELTVDYALYGQAVVVNEDRSLRQTYDSFGDETGPNGFDQILAADIQGGIINVFFNDRSNDRGTPGRQEDALLFSFDIFNTELFPGSDRVGTLPRLTPGVDIFADLIYANDTILNFADGSSVSEALTNGAVGTLVLSTEIEEDALKETGNANRPFGGGSDGVRDPGTIPGDFGQFSGGLLDDLLVPAASNQAGFGYFFPGNGAVTPTGYIINQQNDFGTCDPSFFDNAANGLFDNSCNDGRGGVATTDIIPQNVDLAARSVLDTIKAGGGDNLILARATKPEATFRITVSEPGTLALLGLSLLGLRRIRRMRK